MILLLIHEVLLCQVPLLSSLHQMFLSQTDTIQLVQEAAIGHSVTSPPSYLIQLHLG